MKDWIKVVTDPMGLAGFALFLVFTFLARKGKKPAWMSAWAYAMACTALVGGLVLGYFRVRENSSPHLPAAASQPAPAPAPATTNQQAIGEINQQSTGNGAVNAAGVQGPMTVNNSTTPLPSPHPEKSKNGKK